MIDEYLEDQPVPVKILKTAIKNNKYSHAYLFETNGYKNKTKMALAFAKMLLCPYNYSNNDNCGNCTQCKNIDKNLYSEIKIIEPDGLWIKKDQLSDLQKEFSKKSISSTNKVYIINNAERLNVQAANSILKFLEEPVPNVIAILITDNVHQLLDTIISRCQVITFSRKDKNIVNGTIDNIKKNISVSIFDEELLKKIDNVFTFINFYEQNKLNTLLETQKLWHNNIKEKVDIQLALELIMLIYKDSLNVKLNRKIEIFNEYEENVVNVVKENTIKQLYSKINVVMETIDKVNYNINNNLLIDKMILELERCDKND